MKTNIENENTTFFRNQGIDCKTVKIPSNFLKPMQDKEQKILKILNLKYKLEEVDEMEAEADITTLHSEQKIIIKKGMDKESRDQLLLSVVLETILYGSGYLELNDDNDEMILYLTKSIYRVFNDNEDLFNLCSSYRAKLEEENA